MKPILTKIIYTILALSVVCCLAGCGQLIVDRPDGSRLKVNTLFMSTGLGGLYHDEDFTEIKDWQGKTDNIEFKYNPYTGVRIKTESNLKEM